MTDRGVDPAMPSRTRREFLRRAGAAWATLGTAPLAGCGAGVGADADAEEDDNNDKHERDNHAITADPRLPPRKGQTRGHTHTLAQSIAVDMCSILLQRNQAERNVCTDS